MPRWLSGPGCLPRPGSSTFLYHLQPFLCLSRLNGVLCRRARDLSVHDETSYPSRLAIFMMGFALFWVMQLHLSWPVLAPFFLLAFYYQARAGTLAISCARWAGLPSVRSITGSLLVPTFFEVWTMAKGNGWNRLRQSAFNTENLTSLWGIVQRTLSFASFEVPRLLGPHTVDRIAFLKDEPWLIPFVLFLFVVGTLQVVALLI